MPGGRSRSVTRRSVVPALPKRSVNSNGQAVVSGGNGNNERPKRSRRHAVTDDGRPRILVLDKPRTRSPLLTQFYDHISRPSSPLAVLRDTRVNRPAEMIIKDRYGKTGLAPDYVYWGFTRGSALKRSAEYLNRNGIKVIIDIGDLQYFDTHFSNISALRHVRFLLARWPKTPKYKHLAELVEIKKHNSFLEHAEIVNVPWGIDPNKYTSKYSNMPKDMDVSMICSSGNKYYHSNRRLALAAIRKINGITSFTKPVYGQKYIDMLYRSKIFVVEGSRRNFLVQKYLEAAVCGAMLMGELPVTGKTVFEHGKSIIGVSRYSNLEPNIRYFLEHPAERDRIAGLARKRVVKNYSLENTTAEFQAAILRDHTGAAPMATRNNTIITPKSRRARKPRTRVSVSPRRVGR